MTPVVRSATVALTIALASTALAGCGTPVALRTQANPTSACMDALAIGMLVTSVKSGLALQAENGTVLEVEWPFGYTARREATGLALYDNAGVLVAHEGQRVQAGGGSGADNVFHACPGSVSVSQDNGGG